MRQSHLLLTKMSGLMMIFTLLFITPLALAQQEARLYLEPVSMNSEAVVFDVIAENVTEMYGAEFKLTYDPQVLMVADLNSEQEGVQIAPGTLLPVEQGFVVANKVNDAEGSVTFAVTLLNPAPAASGSGPLATVAFNIQQQVPATIEIVHAKLVSVDLQTIASQTSAFSITPDETVAVEQFAEAPGANLAQVSDQAAASSPTVSFPWWIVAASIIVLGTLALGGLIIMAQPKPIPVNAPSVADTKRSYPTTSLSQNTRPSAFKQQTFPPDTPQ